MAAKYYIAVRGTRGTINPANQIDYLNTHSIGNGPVLQSDHGKWALLENLFDPQSYRANVYRGWYCIHYHQVRPADRPRMIEAFEAIQQRHDQIWVGLFREVAMYGQQRDTARLQITGVTDSAILMTLGDDMHDELFAYPLTVKVRLPADWTAAQAEQNGESIEARLIEHQGIGFALIQAVPDRGPIVVERKSL